MRARPKKPESGTEGLPETGPGHQGPSAELNVAVSSERQPRPARWVIVAVAVVLVLSLAVLAVWQLRARARAPTGIRSLAVLPLENLSGDASQEYFADGMTDQLITDLA
jgi:hypothetical protein